MSGIPRYDDLDSNESDDSMISSTVISREPTVTTEDNAEYEDYDNEEKSSISESFYFSPRKDYNLYIFENNNNASDCLIIGLKEKQSLYISGIFNIQVIKGGIMYNNVHYNSSENMTTMWHPLSNSVPAIQSSYYAGWEEPKDYSQKYSKAMNPEYYTEFVSILKLTNSKIEGLTEAYRLFPDVRYLWKCKDYSLTSDRFNFCILNEKKDSFNPLKVPDTWAQSIDKLQLFHRNCTYDMRVMVIGGKNSGKSTFLRLLMEKLFSQSNYNSSAREDETVMYLDLDPGQPEYSHPDCISLNQINQFYKSLGQKFAQHSFNTLQQFYLGTSSPQDDPQTYLNLVDRLMTTFEEQSFVGTSFLNLPGWIKGFGMNIINHVIRKYKPTNVIILDTGKSHAFDELDIPPIFSNPLQDNYKVNILKVPAFKGPQEYYSESNQPQLKFNAPQLRTLKTLLLFHNTDKSNTSLKYDFTPLLLNSPLCISFGNTGIRGIQLPEEFKNMHAEDIKGALEGTMVGLHTIEDDVLLDVKANGSYPIIQNNLVESLKYITLAIIHSIDETKNVIRMYIPASKINSIKASEKSMKWVIYRNKSEIPFCELYPPSNTLEGKINMDNIPYVSVKRRKKHEHVWKVRKNVQRRGHLTR